MKSKLATGVVVPLPVRTTPGGAAFGRRRHQLRPNASSRWGRPLFEAEDPRSTCSAEPEPVALAADASCRTHGTPGTRPCSPLSTEDPSSRDAPTSRGPGSEASSIDRSTVRPRALARQRPASVTTRKASPPSCGFRPAFTHTLVCARCHGAELFAPRRGTTRRPSTSAIGRVREHTSRTSQTPTLTWRINATGWSAAPRRAPPAELSAGQGPRAFRTRFRHPPRRPLALGGFTPTRSARAPVSLLRVSLGVETSERDAHAVVGLFRTESPAQDAASAPAPEGRLATSLAKELAV